MIPVPDESGDVYWNTAEVAEALGCTRSYVSVLRSRAKEGKGSAPPSFQFGRTLWTRKSAVAAWLSEQEETNLEQD
jgi:hypothetical protein